LITENEEIKEGEARLIPGNKMYYYAGLSRMTNGFVQEQICNTEEMERLEEIIE
jgi:glucan-binding YG repeat protein